VRLLDIIFIYIGAISVAVTLGAYVTQRWWKTRVGRYIVMLKMVLVLIYARSITVVIFTPERIRTDIGTVLITVISSLILAYGAFAFVLTIRTERVVEERKNENNVRLSDTSKYPD
jgi:hypothetical protein